MKNKLIIYWVIYAFTNAQSIDINALKTLGSAKFGITETKNTKDIQKQTNFILDLPIDPKLYMMGPGDQIKVNIVSSNEVFNYSKTQTAYPSTKNEQFLNADIFGVAPYRVYMISLQLSCTFFLLH